MIRVVGERVNPALWLLVAGCVLVLHGACRAEADERGLWELWQRQVAAPDDHAAMADACREFSAAHQGQSFVAFSDTLLAWHLLQLKQVDDARGLLERYASLGSDPLVRGAAAMAKAWLTRMERDRVREALQFFYRKNVRYPRNLSELEGVKELPAELVPRFKDWFGAAWSYRLTGMKSIPGLLDQKYELQSQELGKDSDYAEALAVPYGARIRVRPVGIQSRVEGREILELAIDQRPDAVMELDGAVARRAAGHTVLASVNSWDHGAFIGYVGKALVIVNDYYHWQVFTAPRGK